MFAHYEGQVNRKQCEINLQADSCHWLVGTSLILLITVAIVEGGRPVAAISRNDVTHYLMGVLME